MLSYLRSILVQAECSECRVTRWSIWWICIHGHICNKYQMETIKKVLVRLLNIMNPALSRLRLCHLHLKVTQECVHQVVFQAFHRFEILAEKHTTARSKPRTGWAGGLSTKAAHGYSQVNDPRSRHGGWLCWRRILLVSQFPHRPGLVGSATSCTSVTSTGSSRRPIFWAFALTYIHGTILHETILRCVSRPQRAFDPLPAW